MSSKHPNINFSIEKEKDGCLPFLDVNIFCENKKFATNVYRRKTFSRIYTNFKSFIPKTYKIGLIKPLLFWCFSLCSDFIKFYHEIDNLKSILYKNRYPRNLVDKCIKVFLDTILAPKPVVSTVPKKNLLIALSYLVSFLFNCTQKLIAQWEINSRTVMSDFFSRLSAKLVTFLDLKTKFHRFFVLALFTNFSAVAVMLPIMAK